MNKYFYVLFTFWGAMLFSQVPQYSQFYANSLYLNPAFAGADHSTRAILASRYQWPNLDANYTTTTISIDHHFSPIHSGVGLIITYDRIMPSQLTTTTIGGIYSYEAEISKDLIFRFGLEVAIAMSSIDPSQLSFASQYTDDGYVGGASNETFSSTRSSYLDISAGGLLVGHSFWTGLTVNHLTEPNQGLYSSEELPIKYSLFGGYKFNFTPEWKHRYVNHDEEKSISPTFLYKAQGKSDQIDIGVYGRYNHFAWGLVYRGIPIKRYDTSESNNDALILIIGAVLKNTNIGYSFDITASKLTMGTFGSHEITLVQRIAKAKENHLSHRRPQCPKF